jgi:hypothetical protein
MHLTDLFTVSLERRNKQFSPEHKIEWVNVKEASENKSEVKLVRVLVEVSSLDSKWGRNSRKIGAWNLHSLRR